MPECHICGKPYKSKSGLRDHLKTHAPAAPQPPDLFTVAPDDQPALALALQDLGLTRADVLSFRVYPDQVVIIQGPTGFKRIIPRGPHQ